MADSIKVYEYKNCGTCKKAFKYLEQKDVEVKKIPIREQPPNKTEIKKMLKWYEGKLNKLFNTSGGDYKSLGLKDKLPTMSEAQAIDLLTSNGNLVKRPFMIGKDWGIVGFKEELWDELPLK